MDLIKIGKYIVGKRKELGMTQRQLAEKLGMSDKSVSKWERGVCLPDVSVYSDLCSILGISINEFLAGEDISHENVIQKSEENIIGVATDSKHKQKRLKSIICVLLAISLVAISVIGTMVFRSNRPQNYIGPIDKDSIEMKTAEMLSGSDGAYIYNYITTDEFTSLKIYISEYQSGKLVNKEDFELDYKDIGSPKSGTILIVPDFNNFVVKLIIADDGSKLSTEIPILEEVPEREYYGRCATQIDDKTPVRYNEEQGLAALIYGKKQLRTLDLQELMDGNTDSAADNDYVYCFSFEFCKK